MKYPILTRFIIVSVLVVLFDGCQTKKTKPKQHFMAENFVPPYTLIVPEDWTTERFGIPIEFAPSIAYTGIEEVRFAPGWDDPTREDYWTYSYLWYLNGKISFDARTISENLEAYYTGLIGRNIEPRKIPKEKLFQVKANFEPVQSHEGDVDTFRGNVHMLDYMKQEPIVLNFLVHVKACPGKENTYVFYKVSPQKESHEIWTTLNKIWSEFQCDVK